MKFRIPDTLGLPVQSKVETELLKLLAARSRPLATAEVYRALADTFGLTLSQRTARWREGSADPAWNWLIRRAMERIEKKEKWAYRPERGLWGATETGRNRAKYLVEGLPDIFAET